MYQKRPHVVWKELHRQSYLEEIIRLAGRGDFQSAKDCPDCLARRAMPCVPEYRCLECLIPDLVCLSCCVKRHRCHPLHRISVRVYLHTCFINNSFYICRNGQVRGLRKLASNLWVSWFNLTTLVHFARIRFLATAPCSSSIPTESTRSPYVIAGASRQYLNTSSSFAEGYTQHPNFLSRRVPLFNFSTSCTS